MEKLFFVVDNNRIGESRQIIVGAQCAEMYDYRQGRFVRLTAWEGLEELAYWAARVAGYKSAALNHKNKVLCCVDRGQ